MKGNTVELGNSEFVIRFELNDGIRLAGIDNLKTGDTYLKAPCGHGNPFSLRWIDPQNSCPIWLHSGSDFGVTDVVSTEENDEARLIVTGRCRQIPLEVRLSVVVPSRGPASQWDLRVENLSREHIQGEVFFPQLCGVIPGRDILNLDACLPIQLGGIRHSFIKSIHRFLYAFPDSFVADAKLTYAGPFALPMLDLLDGDETEGLFLVVKDPQKRSVNLSITTIGDPVIPVVQASHELDLPPGESQILPTVTVGVHAGDWRCAVDDYRQWMAGRLNPRDVPSWFREAPAIYGVGGVGGGGGFLAGGMPGREMTARFAGPLDSEIRSFDDLPRLLERARRMGTDVIYVWDYWEGEGETGMPPYENKGDYLPRNDLGGIPAFKRGVEAVHSLGGRILVYVEGFIVYKNSHLGQEKGRDMALLDPYGVYYEDYFNYWSMCPADFGWQGTLVEICQRLVGDYGVDGVFLDSIGAQWNHRCYNPKHSHWPASDVWNQGVAGLVDRVRRSIREIRSDTVVMTESSCDLLLPYEDGASDGSFVWHLGLNEGKLLGSPYRYAYPNLNVFSNGHSKAQLNQIVALGGNMAIGPRWGELEEYIAQLAALKREYKDALVYGRSAVPLKTSSRNVVAVAYSGERHCVVHAVNVGDAGTLAEIDMPTTEPDLEWHSPHSSQGRIPVHGQLSVDLAAGELKTWVSELHRGDVAGE